MIIQFIVNRVDGPPSRCMECCVPAWEHNFSVSFIRNSINGLGLRKYSLVMQYELFMYTMYETKLTCFIKPQIEMCVAYTK